MEQKTKEWYDARRGRVTSTGAKALMAARGLGKLADTYALELAGIECQEMFDDESMVTYAMQHGIDTEPIAREAYELSRMVTVQEIGFVTRGEHLGASPDGLVGEDGMVEIKCPQPGTHKKYLVTDEGVKTYEDQIQFQMYVCERKWCDFITFNDYFKEGYQMRVTRVYPDLKWVEKFESRLGEFLPIVEKYNNQLNQFKNEH